MVSKYGEPGAPQAGFSECATQYGQGDAAMWYDATSAVGVIEDPEAQQGGRQERLCLGAEPGRPPVRLAVHLVARDPRDLPHKQAALEVRLLDDAKDYIEKVGQQAGLVARAAGQPRRPPTRYREYKKLSALYGPLTLQSINATQPGHTPRCNRCRTPACSSWPSRSSRIWAPG